MLYMPDAIPDKTGRMAMGIDVGFIYRECKSRLDYFVFKSTLTH